MPTSYYGQISSILNIILETRPKTILDIGIGFGKYGVLCREIFDIPYERYSKETWQLRIDGIEGYANYNNPIHNYVYDNVYYDKAEEVISTLETSYDLGLMIDILEHFDKSEGEQMLGKVLKTCKKLLISVPAIPCPQSYLDNDLEEHKSQWVEADFMKYNVLKSGFLPMGRNNANIVVLLEGK